MKRTGWFLLVGFFIIAPWRFAFCAEHDFGKWEKAIVAFEENDRTNPPPKHAVLFTGSSTIVRWKTLAQDFPNHRVINRGFGGSQIADAAHFADRIVIPYEPRMVFLRAGGNDIAAGKSPEQVFADYQEFVAKVHTKLPHTTIVFISLCPNVKRWANAEKEKSLNQMVEAYTRDKPYMEYIETYSMSLGPDGKPRPELFIDKLHFNAAGYELLAESVRPYLPKSQ